MLETPYALLEKPYVLTDVTALGSSEVHSMHESLIAQSCVIRWLNEGERMILSFKAGQLRTSIVEDIEIENEQIMVQTANNRYTFTTHV